MTKDSAMFEAMLTEEQRSLRNEVREFVRSVPRQLILDIDADRVQYPRDFVREAGRRNLLGLRFPLQYGGPGLRWEDEIFAIEEVAVLGTSLKILVRIGTNGLDVDQSTADDKGHHSNGSSPNLGHGLCLCSCGNGGWSSGSRRRRRFDVLWSTAFGGLRLRRLLLLQEAPCSGVVCSRRALVSDRTQTREALRLSCSSGTDTDFQELNRQDQ